MSHTAPLVSIIIPCRNEEKDIAACLDGVISFDYPQERMEVLVVDGVSSDSTRAIVRKYCDKYKFIHLLENPAKIAPSAMNIGIKSAKGEFIVRLDAHSEYPRNYLKSCLELLIRTGAGNAGGRFVNVPNGQGAWAGPISFVTGHIFGVGNGAFRVSNTAGFVDTVPFGTYRRELFDEIGYYDERLTRNQDNELNARIRRSGRQIAFDPSIQIRYKNQSSLAGLLHQAFYTGMWNVYTLSLYPYTFQWRRFVPAAFLLYLLCGLSLFFALSPADRYILSLPLLAYFLIDLFVSFSSPCDIIGKGRTALTFFLYHSLYGAGTLFGLWNRLTGEWVNFLGRPLKA